MPVPITAEVLEKSVFRRRSWVRVSAGRQAAGKTLVAVAVEPNFFVW